MSVLSRLEQVIERFVEGGAFRVFGGQLQPVEIAKRLVRAMESRREVGLNGPIVPNVYNVHLSPTDYDRFAPRRGSLEWELSDYLIEAAAKRGIRLDRRPQVRLSANDRLGRHQIEVAAGYADEPPVSYAAEVESGETARLQAVAPPKPVLRLLRPDGGEVAGVDRYPYSIGRGSDNDLVINDRRVSRHHAQVRDLDGRLFLIDLESTNGTFLNGRPVRQTALTGDGVISLGGYELRVSLGAGGSR